MSECIFCSLNKLTRKSVVSENNLFKTILDPFPASSGHQLIVPNQHVERIDELNDEEMKKLRDRISEAKKVVEEREVVKDTYFEALKADSEKSEEMIKAVIGEDRKPEGFNIGINEGEAAGQTINHLHVHVIPRYDGDVENPRGGVRNVIPDKADYT